MLATPQLRPTSALRAAAGLVILYNLSFNIQPTCTLYCIIIYLASIYFNSSQILNFYRRFTHNYSLIFPALYTLLYIIIYHPIIICILYLKRGARASNRTHAPRHFYCLQFYLKLLSDSLNIRPLSPALFLLNPLLHNSSFIFQPTGRAAHGLPAADIAGPHRETGLPFANRTDLGTISPGVLLPQVFRHPSGLQSGMYAANGRFIVR